MSEEACLYCGSPATRLCDFIVGRERVGYEWVEGTLRDPFQGYTPRTSIDARHFTCDRPLCDDCTTHLGHIFIDGDKAHTCIDSIDRCREHADAEQDPPVISEAEADVIRGRMPKGFGVIGD